MSEKILNIDEACEFLGIKRRTIYKLLKEGSLPAVKIGGQWRFSQEVLMDLFRRQTTGPVPPVPR
ncbi:MAG: helix-turn-helix domain-containing protein [Candidatus Neomarinimicrobiota bacterium]